MIESVAFGDWTQSPALLPPWRPGKGSCWEFQPSNRFLIFVASSPHLEALYLRVHKSHLISKNSGMVEKGFLWITRHSCYFCNSGNFKSFGSSMPGTRVKDQIDTFRYIPGPSPQEKNHSRACLIRTVGNQRQEKILKAARGEKGTPYLWWDKDTVASCSSETMQTRREGSEVFRMLKGKNFFIQTNNILSICAVI